MSMVRLIWPITDETVSYAELCRQAAVDIPMLLARAHAKATGRGRFSIAPSVAVPGSGRVTESVLLWEAPAVAAPRRNYRQPPRRDAA